MKGTVHSCSGKTALVTSAARGTGRAVAVALGKAGAQVLVHHARPPATADKNVTDIRTSGGKATALAVDLSSFDVTHVSPLKVYAGGSHGLARSMRAGSTPIASPSSRSEARAVRPKRGFAGTAKNFLASGNPHIAGEPRPACFGHGRHHPGVSP